jgi:hypothetical protein
MAMAIKISDEAMEPGGPPIERGNTLRQKIFVDNR